MPPSDSPAPTTVHLLPGTLDGQLGAAGPNALSMVLQFGGHVGVRNDLITIFENYFDIQLFLKGACKRQMLIFAFTWWQPFHPEKAFTPAKFKLTCALNTDLAINIQKSSTNTQNGQAITFEVDGDKLTQILQSGKDNNLQVNFENLLPGGHVNNILAAIHQK